MRVFLQALHNRIYLSALLIALCLLLAETPALAQCPNNNAVLATVANIPCGADGVISIGAGTAATFPVVANATYIFRTCGSTPLTGTTFNTQLTGYDGIGSLAFYNDDAGGFCANCTSAGCSDPGSTATESYVSWPSTFTGTVTVNVDLFNCDPCGATNCPALGSAALQYRQVNNLFFTSSGAAMCSGTSRNLTAVPPGGTFSDLNGYVAGNTFTAPATGGTYTITYTLGSCSATQDIVFNSAYHHQRYYQYLCRRQHHPYSG
jgi:hypothetical protein